MPLKQGSSQAVISANIKELVEAGHEPKQAAAIAYKTAGKDCGLSEDECVALAQRMVAQDRILITFDRSVRTFDKDGRLHIAVCNISKAQVSEYYGREIPGADALGLLPDTIYPILRGPEALAKAAPTFNNLPLMDEHIVVSADDPQKDRVVGSTGTDAEFNGEYLRNSLVIWDADMIARIESGEQKEISCAYRYVAAKMAGTYKGLTHSLSMDNIEGNHVALVPKGRAGPDVVVGDSEQDMPMPKRLTSKKALLARGALAAVLKPLIAADAQPDIIGALQGVNRANFKAMKATVAERLAKDKTITSEALESVKVALDAMEKEDCEGEDDEMEEKKEEAKDKKAKDRRAKDESEEEKAEDEETEEEEKAKDRRAKDKKAKDEEESPSKEKEERENARAEDKKAWDSAIKSAVAKMRSDTISEMNAITQAKEDVAPLVGPITGAMDSAEDVYKFALDHAGVSLDGTESLSALKTMVGLTASRSEPVRIANDSQPRGGELMQMFPGLRRISQG